MILLVLGLGANAIPAIDTAIPVLATRAYELTEGAPGFRHRPVERAGVNGRGRVPVHIRLVGQHIRRAVNPKTGEIIYVATVQSDTNIDLLTLARH